MEDNVLSPSPALLAKLGSVVVHVEEAAVENHPFDRAALLSLLGDPEVVAWLSGMEKLAMLPVKRARG